MLDTTALVQEAIDRHHTTPVAAAALGRALTATAYLCGWLKAKESTLSVSIAGGGVGGKISVAGDGDLNMRGFIEHPEAELPLRSDGKLDVGGCVGKDGTLTVIRDDGEGIPFVGTSVLVSGEIAEDFSAYFLTSEQRPTAIALGVKIGKDGNCLGAGGVFLQPLPGASEENLTKAEETIAQYSRISSLIQEKGVKEILRAFGVGTCEEREIAFHCRCSRDRARSALYSLGKTEAEELLKNEGNICVHCHDCNTDYLFGQNDIDKIFGKEI